MPSSGPMPDRTPSASSHHLQGLPCRGLPLLPVLLAAAGQTALPARELLARPDLEGLGAVEVEIVDGVVGEELAGPLVSVGQPVIAADLGPRLVDPAAVVGLEVLAAVLHLQIPLPVLH